MSEPYLVAHIVRGQPAFDIAEQMACPECEAKGCAQCDEQGHWWIIPTSGHRAYPYWFIALNDVPDLELLFTTPALSDPRTNPPTPWPDHYPAKSSTSAPPSNPRGLLASLGLLTPTEPLKRRV